MKSSKKYPNISMAIGGVLSFAYSLLIAYLFLQQNKLLFVLLSVGYLAVYWYAMYRVKNNFMLEDFSVAKARLVNIGGFFLFFFATFFTCINNMRFAG